MNDLRHQLLVAWLLYVVGFGLVGLGVRRLRRIGLQRRWRKGYETVDLTEFRDGIGGER